MLILTRRQGKPTGETLIIGLPTGEQIQVTVSSIKGNQVKIGTDAPEDIAIVREELLDKA
jgi:carbon storage regulator